MEDREHRVEYQALATALFSCAATVATVWCCYFAWPDSFSYFVMWPFVFFAALFFSIVLGLPLYWLLRVRKWLWWWTAPLVGFLIGVLPTIPFIMQGEILPACGMGLLGAAGGGAGWHAWRTVYKDYERSPLPALTERANESVEFVHRSDKDFYAIVAALLTAAATVATVFCIYTGDFFAWRLYAAVSLVWAGTFGLLSYFVLSAWKNLIGKWWLGPIGGFLIGAIPTMLLMVVTGSGDLEATFLAGLLGLCGGTTAWFMWRYVHHLLRLK